MNFTIIGAGWKKTTKTGVAYISIALDKDKVALLKDEDYKKVCLFKNENKKTEKSPDYTMSAPIEEVKK